MRTEISAKFRREGVEAELAAAGFDLGALVDRPGRRFALSLAPSALTTRPPTAGRRCVRDGPGQREAIQRC